MSLNLRGIGKCSCQIAENEILIFFSSKVLIWPSQKVLRDWQMVLYQSREAPYQRHYSALKGDMGSSPGRRLLDLGPDLLNKPEPAL